MNMNAESSLYFTELSQEVGTWPSAFRVFFFLIFSLTAVLAQCGLKRNKKKKNTLVQQVNIPQNRWKITPHTHSLRVLHPCIPPTKTR